MHIPKSFPAFHKKTLVVIADHIHAKLFLGEDHELTFLKEFKTDHTEPEAGERTSLITSTGGHGAVMNEKESIIDEDHLFHSLAKELYLKLKNHEFENLLIAAGPEVYQLEKILHPDVRSHITHLIPKLLTKLNEEHLIEHLWT